jgi:hypothetical protein
MPGDLEKENLRLRDDLKWALSCLDDAEEVIQRGVKLMPLEKLGKWEGVRATLEYNAECVSTVRKRLLQ